MSNWLQYESGRFSIWCLYLVINFNTYKYGYLNSTKKFMHQSIETRRPPYPASKGPSISLDKSVIRQCQNYRKCMEKSTFSKNWSRTPLHSRVSLLFLWTRKLLISRRTWQICGERGDRSGQKNQIIFN